MTKKLIENLAKEYAEKENSCYTNDMYGFIAGFEASQKILKDYIDSIDSPMDLSIFQLIIINKIRKNVLGEQKYNFDK